jgi:hypothetical protein
MNEIFGEENRLGIVARIGKTAVIRATYFAPSNDHT